MAYPKEVAGLNLPQMSIIVAKGNPLQTIDARQVAVNKEA